MQKSFLEYPYISGGGLFPGTSILRTWKNAKTLETADIPVDEQDVNNAIWIAFCSVIVSRTQLLIDEVAYRRRNFIFGNLKEAADSAHLEITGLIQRMRVGGYDIKDREFFLTKLYHAYQGFLGFCNSPKNKKEHEKTERIIQAALFRNKPK